ncbi:MAG: glycosyltransferase family 9 protein [Bacteroidia bacterium]
MKIAVVRLSALGDIIMIEPLLRALMNQGHELHLITKPSNCALFDDYAEPLRVHAWTSFAEANDLRNLGFDAVIDAHNNLRSRFISTWLWPAAVYRVSKEAWKKGAHALGLKWPVTPFQTRLLQAAKPLLASGADIQGLWPVRSAQTGEGTYRVLVLGGTYATKQIPLSLCADVLNRAGGSWVLLGGSDDLSRAQELHAMLNAGLQVQIHCGQSLVASQRLIQGSSVVISGDTGMAHWAAALGKPLQVIWGNTHPLYGLSPGQWPGARVTHHQVQDLDCRPCTKFGHDRCPKGHFRCMMNQKAEAIVAELENLD